MPKPLYTSKDLRIVHNLHYDWTGWLSKGHGDFPPNTEEAINQCRKL